jgi:hypothetical protein
VPPSTPLCGGCNGGGGGDGGGSCGGSGGCQCGGSGCCMLLKVFGAVAVRQTHNAQPRFTVSARTKRIKSTFFVRPHTSCCCCNSADSACCKGDIWGLAVRTAFHKSFTTSLCVFVVLGTYLQFGVKARTIRVIFADATCAPVSCRCGDGWCGGSGSRRR